MRGQCWEEGMENFHSRKWKLFAQKHGEKKMFFFIMRLFSFGFLRFFFSEILKLLVNLFMDCVIRNLNNFILVYCSRENFKWNTYLTILSWPGLPQSYFFTVPYNVGYWWNTWFYLNSFWDQFLKRNDFLSTILQEISTGSKLNLLREKLFQTVCY